MRAELLAPAGSYESLRAAVNAGADAVYIGGPKFGARAYADNLDIEQLKAAIDFCHIHNRKLYLTVNTILKAGELEGLYDYLRPLYEQGLDAVIVQDMGVIRELRRMFPGLDLHGSTQMTVTGPAGAAFLEQQGLSRVVTARELSLTEISAIRAATNIEIESFVHGALCYCYSGQCLFSSLLGGRSGNRGRCAQPCRLPYQTDRLNGNLLSPKDICTLDILPEIISSGVYSLKIEGRMKRPEYTAGVVQIYRKYLDYYLRSGGEHYRIEPEDRRQLMALYNRGGFTTGYYQQRNGKKMLSLDRVNHFGTEAARITARKKSTASLQALEDLHAGDILEKTTLDENVKKGNTFQIKLNSTEPAKAGMILHRTRDQQLISELNERYLKEECKEKINGNLMIELEKPVILTVTLGKLEITVSGDIPSPAQKQPLDPAKVRKQLLKTGSTPFVFERLDLTVGEGLFLPLQSLNELRRTALEQLQAAALNSHYRTVSGNLPTDSPEPADSPEPEALMAYTSLEDLRLFPVLSQAVGLDGLYLDSSCFDLPPTAADVKVYLQQCHDRGKACYYIMPAIFRQREQQLFEQNNTLAVLELFDGVLIKNYESWQYLLAGSYSREMILDHNMYTLQQPARLFARERGIGRDTAPVELNERELRQRCNHASEMLVYGYLPMMISAQCIRKTTSGCQKQSGITWMTDRKGKRFPVKNYCQPCYNIIYNQVPLHLLDNFKEVMRLKFGSIRLAFTIEEAAEAAAVTAAYIDVFKGGKELKYNFAEFTRGHFKRGIE